MAKAHLKLVTPVTVKRTITPRRLPNKEIRTREHMTEAEFEHLMTAAKSNRYGHRDATMILVAYRPAYGPPNWSISNGRRTSDLKKPSACNR